MRTPAVPPDEQKRLAALYSPGILDTEREERFDRITRLTAALLDVPIALVTLVDRERHWFKSVFGIDVVESPRDSKSFCGHAIGSDALFAIPDTLTDPHFSDNSLVTGEAGIRFYAGHPLKAVDGSRVGTLCVMDRQPRTLTTAQTAQLQDLAAIAEDELNLAHHQSVLRNQLAAIVESSNDAIYSRSLDGRILSWNAGAERMLGYTAAEAVGRTGDLGTPPGRPPKLREYFERLLRGEQVEDVSDRLTKDGKLIDVINSLSPIRDNAGNIVGMSIIVRDITALKRTQTALEESEARLRTTFEQAAVGIAHIDVRTLRILMANDKFCYLLGYTRGELIGVDARAVTPADDVAACETERAGVIAGATRMSTTERRLIRKDGETHWFRRSLSLVCDAKGQPAHFIAVLDDIDARKEAEMMLTLQKNVLEQIASGASLREALSTLARSIEAHAGNILCSILLLDKDGVHLRHGAAPSLPEAYCRAIDGVAIGPAVGSCATAAFRRETVVVEDIANDPLWKDFSAIALSHGLRACWSTPILNAEHKVMGTFAIYYREPGLPSARHRELVRLATDLAVIAIDKHESEATLRMMRLSVDGAGDSVFWTSRDGRILYVNDAACAVRGYAREELLDLTISDLNPNFSPKEWETHFETLKRHGSMTFESSHRTKDGRVFPMDVTANYVNINGQEFNFSFSRDITERKQIENSLRLTQFSIDRAVDSVFWIKPNAEIIYANDAACRTLGYTRDEIIGKTVPDIDPHFPAEKWPTHWEELKQRKSLTFESDHSTADGGLIHTEVTANYIHFQGQEYNCAIMRDITQRKQADAEHALLATIVENATDAIISRKLDGTILSWNSAAEKLFGYTAAEAIGRPIDIIMPATNDPIVREHSRLVATGHAIPSEEVTRLTKDGRLVHVIRGISPIRNDAQEIIGAAVIMHDVSALKQAEEVRAALEAQLRQSQKMEAIGTLAGGVAHDFNNILTIILGNVALARQDAGASAPITESLTEIHKAGSRARDLVQQILSFSRRQPTERKNIALAPVIAESARLLRATLPARLRLETHCEPDTPFVLADANQIQQALLNLATNAMQATPGPGSIAVRLDTILLDATLAKSCPILNKLYQAHPGRTVRLAVKDTGVGMEPAMLSRIFEPFFTTKPQGEGTGLGLSVVHGIMEGHEGAVTVESRSGQGTTFTLYFPEAAPASMVPAAGSRTTPGATSSNAIKDKRIIYIDDDESLVFLVERMLKRVGYQVSAYTDQTQALEAVRKDPHAYDLIVSDYNMPGMSGIDIAREMRAIRPDLPVAVTSGFIDDNLRSQAMTAGVRELIFKVISMEEYCAAIQRLV